ncbi:DUF4192 family protein [Bifidobacterium panos]|uniref:DUF4192 family protein n=1 Tax=Bifidobacterium panos TaxID=2675321 RepID=A0ABX1SWM7_9BIFI|nr:DUF4192 family protein [Bifidobacterium sp. DSM 109963]NMN02241.1 hypothetical protein [Bifidobacterium sp. DSM 109963]
MTSTTNHASRHAHERPTGKTAKGPGQRQDAHSRGRRRKDDGTRRPNKRLGRAIHIDCPEECELFFANLEPFTQNRMRKLREQLRRNRRDMGPEQANAEWIQEPLNAWLSQLDTRTIDLDEENMAALAVGLNEVMSIRDALIISLIVDETACDADMLMDIVSRPCTRRVSKSVHHLLSEAFDDELGPDRARCQAGLMMLNAMAKMVPKPMRAQPLAVIAYVLWWVGDSRASSYALQSLEVDRDCSLAAIVLRTLDCGMEPACCDE